MADPTFIHVFLQGVVNGVTGTTGDIPSEGGVLIALFLVVIGGAVLYRECTKKSSPDPTLHMPDPPGVEHQPQRGLPPPASRYAEWSAEEDKKKDDAPWIRR